MKCTVEIFGLPDDITRLSKVTVELADGADLKQLIRALRGAIPALEGPVVADGEDRLDPEYGFNVNGRFYSDDLSVRLHSGDRVALLSLATGG